MYFSHGSDVDVVGGTHIVKQRIVLHYICRYIRKPFGMFSHAYDTPIHLLVLMWYQHAALLSDYVFIPYFPSETLGVMGGRCFCIITSPLCIY